MTATVEVKTPAGEAGGTVELPAEIFDVQANIPLMHQVVVAAARRGAAGHARDEDPRRRPRRWPQAVPAEGHRAGASGLGPRAAVRRRWHGARAHDPGLHPADAEEDEGRGTAGRAVRPARSGQLHVVTELVSGEKPSTKAAKAALAAVTDATRVLVVVDREDERSVLSARNLPYVHLITPDQLNTYDVLVNDDVVFTRAAFDAFLAGPAQHKGAAAATTAEGSVQA